MYLATAIADGARAHLKRMDASDALRLRYADSVLAMLDLAREAPKVCQLSGRPSTQLWMCNANFANQVFRWCAGPTGSLLMDTFLFPG